VEVVREEISQDFTPAVLLSWTDRDPIQSYGKDYKLVFSSFVI